MKSLYDVARYSLPKRELPKTLNTKIGEVLLQMSDSFYLFAKNQPSIKALVTAPYANMANIPASSTFYAFHTCRSPYAAIERLLPNLTDFYIESGVLPIVTALPAVYIKQLESLQKRVYFDVYYRGIILF